jgi:hypothetical protein
MVVAVVVWVSLAAAEEALRMAGFHEPHEGAHTRAPKTGPLRRGALTPGEQGSSPCAGGLAGADPGDRPHRQSPDTSQAKTATVLQGGDGIALVVCEVEHPRDGGFLRMIPGHRGIS